MSPVQPYRELPPSHGLTVPVLLAWCAVSAVAWAGIFLLALYLLHL